MRRLSESGRAEAEIIGLGAAPVGDGNDRHLLVDIVKDGQLVFPGTLEDARTRHRESLAELRRHSGKIPAQNSEFSGIGEVENND